MLQELINIIYRYPKSKLKQIGRMGGYFNVRATERARQTMEKAAADLTCPKYDATDPPGLAIWFLTGKKFWYQTLFCIKSLLESSQQDFMIHICDDGSLNSALISKMRAQVPYIQIHTKEEIELRLSQALPPEAFPYLWHKRSIYPHIKKLTDIHAGNTGWKLVLDSDMLFFQRPELLLHWLASPQQPFFILDRANFYGYSTGLMASLAGGTVHERLNVGAIGLRSESIDFNKLEHWAQTLEAKEGTSYFLEQALSAMLVAGQKLTIGPEEDYVVMPSKEQVLSKSGILHHYVDLSKEWYFKAAWKNYHQ